MNIYLSGEQVDFFKTNGYLVVQKVIDEETLSSLWQEYDQRLAEAATQLVKLGLLTDTFAQYDFDQRYIKLIAETTAIFQYLDISYPLENDNFPVDAPIHTGPAVFALLTHPGLLNVVESIIGPEITSNPVQHARLKPPFKALPSIIAGNSYVGKTTWHQDQGALLDEANESQVLTTWVAITDCPKKRGCLSVIPGSHRKNKLTIHCPGQGIASENYIPASLLGDEKGNKQIVTLPCQSGDVILLHQYTEHAALPNVTDQLRWSFDLRWSPTGHPTGRPAFPSFVARSRQNPGQELRDAQLWAESWQLAKQRIISGDYSGQVFNAERWEKYINASVCA